jgi:3-methyladenine DNA glycosylase AlkD
MSTTADTIAVLAELQRLGTEQNRKIYARHGVPSPCSGVSFASFGQLRQRLGVDPALARGLMASGNSDAQLLATMVCDARALDDAEAQAWVEGARWHGLADALATAFADAPRAPQWARRWMKDGRETVRRTGYSLVACLTRLGRADVDDAWLADVLVTIERELHGSPNFARAAMNTALIAIGGDRPALTAAALAAAKRIGKVEVDHGQTGCKTPDAAEYIAKMRARAAAKAKKPAAKAAPRRAAKAARRKAPARGGAAQRRGATSRKA